jgi:RNA polymerase sigma-70 factor, ECF subfamily
VRYDVADDGGPVAQRAEPEARGGTAGDDRSGATAELDLARVFRDHRSTIFRYLLRRTGDPQLAEDLTQDVFADALAALPRLDRDPRSLLPWLYTVARRRAIDAARAGRAVPVGTLEELPGPAREGGAEPPLAAVVDAVRALPPPQRAVVVMRVLDGRSFAEIGADLGAAESACRMRFSRALRALRESLERAGPALLLVLVDLADPDLQAVFGYI